MDDADIDFERLLEVDSEMNAEKLLPSNHLLNERPRFSASNLKRKLPVEKDCSQFSKCLKPSDDLYTTDKPYIQSLCIKKHFLLKNIPLEGDYISVTFSQGNRFYLKIFDSDPEKYSINLPRPLASNSTSNLVVEAKKLLRQLCSQKNNFETPSYPSRPNFAHLWTKKHAPSSYTDLITDESTNRTLLRWLKAWDSYVFGTSTPAKQQSLARQATVHATNSTQSASRKEDLEYLAGEIEPHDGLPCYRLLLLSGPPGLGKTTLAHLLAEHAGYQVVEMNASDDRNVTVLREMLTAVVTSASSLNQFKTGNSAKQGYLKPCCLIMDEIDGAVPAAVEILANAAKATLHSTTKRRQLGKRNDATLLIRRPVICICNDLYSAAVRPLRVPGVPCLILKLPCIDLARLISRLDTIAKIENIPVDKITLTRLAEVADHDIRSCLNTLQFLDPKHHGETNINSNPVQLSVDELISLTGNNGNFKDVQRSLFDIWKAIFTIPSSLIISNRIQIHSNTKFNMKVERSINTANSSITSRLEYIMDLVESSADPQQISMGVFENYLFGRLKDTTLRIARQASDWFVYHDLIMNYIQSKSNYVLLRYPKWLFGWFHLSFATPLGLLNHSSSSSLFGHKPMGNIRWPSAHIQASTNQSQCISILQHLLTNRWNIPGRNHTKDNLACMNNTNSFRFMSHRTFVLDIGSTLINLFTMMASNLRPLCSQLYSEQEKLHLKTLVNLMLDFGLNLIPQQNHETGELEYCLDPALDEVVCFMKSNTNNFKVIGTTTKQLIARELELERVRRSELLIHINHYPCHHSNSNEVNNQMKNQSISNNIQISNNVKTDLPIKDNLKFKKDFFGRIIDDDSLKSNYDGKPKNIHSNPTDKTDFLHTTSVLNPYVYYRFKEGYSNAVRRPVIFKDFL